MIKKVASRLLILLVLGGAIGGYYYYTVSSIAVDNTLYYGEAQLESYDVYATTAGIVEEIMVQVGDNVVVEQAMMQLDSDLAKIQYERSLVAQSVAEQQVVKSDTGASDEDLNIQGYNIEQLKSQKESLQASISGSWQLHQQSIINSNSLLAAYELQLSTYEDMVVLYEAQLETKANVDRGSLAVTNAKGAYDSAQLSTSKIRSDIASSERQLEALDIQIASAEEGFKKISGGYEDVDKSIVELGENQAALEVASYAYYLEQYEIKAYNNGVVDVIYYDQGEFVNKGSSILSLHNPEVMEVLIYVSEKDLLSLTLGQAMSFSVVADPTIVLEGTIISIAKEAMFTPVNIVTEEDRERLVFEVEVSLEVNDRVKSGMLLVTDTSELEQ